MIKCAFLVLLATLVVQGQISDVEYSQMPILFHEDHYDNCMLNKEKSLYCRFSYWLEPLDNQNPPKIWNIIKTVSDDKTKYRHDHLRHRICVRETCPNIDLNSKDLQTEIEHCYNAKFKPQGLKGNVSKLHCQDAFTTYPIEYMDIIVGVLVVFYIVFVVIASIYEGVARYKPEHEYKAIVSSPLGSFLSIFSLPKNWYRLTEESKSEDAKRLASIQGIRFYNLLCVIMAHTMMADLSQQIANPQFVENTTKNTLNLLIANGGYVVQTNFMIAGWLLTYNFLMMFQGKRKVQFKHILFAFINRFFRLTPTYAFVMFLQATWMSHASNGPNWDEVVGVEYRNCRKNWYLNLFYLNNLIDYKNMCMQHTWYIATDTQLFLYTLVVLMLAFNNPKWTKLIIGGATISGIFLAFLVAYIGDYDILMRQYPEQMYQLNNVKQDTWAYPYASPQSNIGGYMIGVICGYLFYYYKDKKLFTTKFRIVLWWIITYGAPLSVIFFASFIYNENFHYTRLQSALYWALGKNLFAFGLATAIFGCTQGIGWFTRYFTEWTAITVYARISYSAYICHLAFVLMRAGNRRWPLYASEGTLMFNVCGDVAVSCIMALLLCLFVEMPTSGLQKYWVPQLNKDTKENYKKVEKKEE